MNVNPQFPEDRSSDLELFEELSKKQTWALEAIYDRHAARLNGLALKILNDAYMAEEVLQEIFMTIWKDPNRFSQQKGSPLGWMMVLCRNRSIDKLRARQTKIRRSASLNEEVLFQDESWSADNPMDDTVYNELQDQMKYALNSLPVEQSQPIEMAFFQGFSQTEISAELSLPLGTVKTRIRLGMRKLKNLMVAAGYP